MRQAWTCLLIALAGCGGDDAVAPPDAELVAPDAELGPPADLVEISGSRLKLEWWVADGVRVMRRIWDSERGAECDFRLRGQDGDPYCLPPATQVGTIAYADPACTEPRVIVPSWFGQPEIGIGVYVDGCEGAQPSQIYAAGPLTGVADYYVKNGAACTASSGQTVYAAIAPIELSDFVHAELREQPGSTELGTNYLEADDGLIVPFGSHDRVHDEDCFLSVVPRLGEAVCSPSRLAGFARPFTTTYYADSTCSTYAVEASVSCTPKLASDVSFTCGVIDTYTYGAQLSAVYSDAGGACAVAGLQPGVVYYELAEPAPLLRAQPTVEGDGRLGAVFMTTADGLHQHAGAFDRQLGFECSFAIGSDAVARCFPPEVSPLEVYSDPGCTIVVADAAYVSLADDTCTEPTPPPPPYLTLAGEVRAVDPTLQTGYISVGDCLAVEGTFLETTAEPLDLLATVEVERDR